MSRISEFSYPTGHNLEPSHTSEEDNHIDWVYKKLPEGIAFFFLPFPPFLTGRLPCPLLH